MFIKIPTELSDKQIANLQIIYKEAFKRDISKEMAIEYGLSIIRLIAIIITNTGQKI